MVDTVIVDKSKEAQEDPAHIEAMIAKVDATAASEVNTPDPTPAGADTRPEWLPEKFKTPEDLAKAYSELEGKLGTPKPTEGATEGDPKTPEANPEKAAADAALADKGLSFDEFSQEFAENGELTAESYKKLEDAGIPKAIVDQYIAGQQALATRLQTEVKAVAGGDEGFAELSAWAIENVSDEELAAYNKAVSSGDIGQAKLAVAGLYAKFQEARPNEPHLITGGGGRPSAEVYESIAQLQKDMAAPEYKNDPAFRRKVQEKLGRSDIL